MVSEGVPLAPDLVASLTLNQVLANKIANGTLLTLDLGPCLLHGTPLTHDLGHQLASGAP